MNIRNDNLIGNTDKDIWMAPEQFKGESSPESDLYALALFLWEAVTRQIPGKNLSPHKIGAERIKGITEDIKGKVNKLIL